MSLLFNMLSSLLTAFLSRSKHLLISWLQSPFAMILQPMKIVSHCFHCFPICLPWSDGTGYHDLSLFNAEFQVSLKQHRIVRTTKQEAAWKHCKDKRDSCAVWEMATHSSVLAWRIPGMAEPGGLLSMGSHRVGHDWSDLAAAATDSTPSRRSV